MILKVGMDFRPAMGPRAGIGRYVASLAERLAGAVDLRLYGVFWRGNRREVRRAPAPLVAWKVPSRIMDLLGVSGILPADRVVGGCDLFHHTDYVIPEVDPGTPQVMTIHDLAFAHDESWHTPEARYQLMKIVQRAVRRCRGLLVPSEATARDCVERLRFPRERIFVTPLGVAGSFGTVAANDNGPRYLLAVGTIEPRKNHARLIRAFDRVAAREKDLRLVVAGAWGWRTDDVLSAFATSRFKDRIELRGRVAEAELHRLYASSTAVVYPSLFEGFGLPVLEGMAAGRPVLTSSGGALEELAGDAALLVDPYDVEEMAQAMRRIVEDDSLRRNLTAAGLRRSAQFTWDRCAKETHRAYSELVA